METKRISRTTYFKTSWTCFAKKQWRIVWRTVWNVAQRCKKLQHHNTQKQLKQLKQCESCWTKLRNTEKLKPMETPCWFYHLPKWPWICFSLQANSCQLLDLCEDDPAMFSQRFPKERFPCCDSYVFYFKRVFFWCFKWWMFGNG